MSASRSNQAAINRRAGSQQQQAPMQQKQTQGVPSQQVYRQYAQQPQQQQQAKQRQFNPQIPVPQQQQQQQQQQPQNIPSSGPTQIQGGQTMFINQVGNPNGGKISVSDAIALVTLRLGRLETIIEKYEKEGVPTNTDNTTQDNSVIMTLISRIEALEKKPQVQPQLQPTVTITPPTQIDTSAFDERVGHVETDMNDLKRVINKMKTYLNESNNKTKNNDKFMTETDENLSRLDGSMEQVIHKTNEFMSETDQSLNKLNDDIQSLFSEIKDTRDVLMKLQTYTMETNQRLVDMVFSNNYSCGKDETPVLENTLHTVDDCSQSPHFSYNTFTVKKGIFRQDSDTLDFSYEPYENIPYITGGNNNINLKEATILDLNTDTDTDMNINTDADDNNEVINLEFEKNDDLESHVDLQSVSDNIVDENDDNENDDKTSESLEDFNDSEQEDEIPVSMDLKEYIKSQLNTGV